MDYIGLMNWYWVLHRQQAFEPADTHLYNCLLDIFNGKGTGKVWPESISLTDGSLAMLAGINVKTMDRARARLVERGLVGMTKLGQGSRAGSLYAIGATSTATSPVTSPITYPKKGEVNGQHTPSLPPQHTPQHTPKKEKSYIYKVVQTPDRETLNKLVCVADRDDASVRLAIVWCLQHKKPKAKQKKAPPSDAPPLVFPSGWTDEMKHQYAGVWIPFRQKSFRNKLRPESIQGKLSELVDMTESQLTACINHSINNGYQGLFPDKFKQRHAATQQNRNGYQQRPDQSQPYEFDLDRELAKRAGRQNDSAGVVEGDFEFVE